MQFGICTKWLRDLVSDGRLDREDIRFLASAWGLLSLAGLVVLLGYSSIPDPVVLYRPPWADAPTVGAKSWATVGRIFFMGLGQLGAATAMIVAARDSLPWQRFWRWLALTAGVKTLLECMGLLARYGSPAERALTASTYVAVGLFVLGALLGWRRDGFGPHPQLAGGPRFVLVASLALWAVFSVLGRYLA